MIDIQKGLGPLFTSYSREKSWLWPSISLIISYVLMFCLLMCGVQIRTLGMLRSRFQSLPGAFNACLIPEEKAEPTKKKGLKATFSRNFAAVNFSSLCLCLSLRGSNS